MGFSGSVNGTTKNPGFGDFGFCQCKWAYWKQVCQSINGSKGFTILSDPVSGIHRLDSLEHKFGLDMGSQVAHNQRDISNLAQTCCIPFPVQRCHPAICHNHVLQQIQSSVSHCDLVFQSTPNCITPPHSFTFLISGVHMHSCKREVSLVVS